jgi:hypothetical protein
VIHLASWSFLPPAIAFDAIDSEIVLASAPLEVSLELVPDELQAPVERANAVTATTTVDFASLMTSAFHWPVPDSRSNDCHYGTNG